MAIKDRGEKLPFMPVRIALFKPFYHSAQALVRCVDAQ